ncbi:hypothetical protein ABPG74_021872 [Tetrahymena malaccensis]
MKIYFKQLKNLDIYGIPIRVNFQNQEVYKTGFGALISIIVFSVFCLASYYQSSELISRSSPIVLTSEQFVKNPERMVFDKKQQIMIMGLTDLLGNNIYDPQVIQVSSYMTKLSKFSSDQNQILLNMTNLVVRPCDSQDIQSEKLKGLFSNLHLDYFFCFDDNQDVYIEGDLSGDFYSKIDVFFKQCKNSTQPGSVVCKPQEYIDKKTKNIYFLNYMVDKIVDPTNLESPFGYQKINIETQTSSLQSQQFTAYFQNYYIQSDTGLFSKQVNQVQDFQCVQTQSNYVFSEPGLIIQFTIRPYKNKQMLMQRRYMKFSDLAAQIGGLFKILTLIGFVIVFPFSKISLNKEIVNSLFEFNLKNDEQKSKTVYQSNCLLLEKNFIEDQGKLNEKKVKNCKQFMQINQHNQKNTVNQNIEGLSQFSHALDKTNNKNIQNSSLQNQESTIQQVTTSSPNNREVNKENLRLLQFTQFSEIDSLKLQNKEVAPNHAFRRKETQISLKKTKSNFSNQEAILNIFDKEMKQSNQMLLQSKKSLGTIGIQQISSLDQLPINHQFNQIEQYQEHCNVFKDDLRIGQINRGQWTREQTNNKCVESSIQPSMENFSEQDCQQIQKKDQTLQDQTNYLEDFQEKNNQSMAVDRFLKENQLLFNGDSKQESLNQSNQSPNLNFSKINESSDQINKSKVTSQRQHRPSYRFKPDELNNQLESGFKKRKNQKTQQTFGEITLLCHLFACAWFMLGDYQQSNYMLNNWVNVNNLVGSSIVSQYVSSIYFSVVTISTIGYGDIVAKSDIEKVFICFMAIFTSVIFSYILTNIQSVYKGYHSKRKVYIRHLAELNNYLYSRDVNPHLQQMARKYLKYVHTQNHQKRVLPNQTLNVLSKFLKEEIIEEIFKRSIKNIPFLQQFSHQFLNALAHKMKEVNYGPEEIIMKTGSYQVPWLYYIVQGRVEIQLDQSSIQNQKQSQFSEYKTFFEHKETESFGQYEFVSQTHQSQVNVKSLEQTTLHQILLTDFIEVLNQFQVDKEKYQELKDKLNLNENYSCVNVYCQSCKSSSHLLRDCPLFFYKPQKFKIVRLYNWQQEFERNLITRSTDRLILNSLAFQQEIEDDCIFFREENQEELGSMIQLEGDEEYKQKQKLTNQKRSSCDIQSLNLLQKEKPANSKISISIPRLSVQQSNNSALSTIQVEYKAAEIQNDEQKCDFQIDSKQEIQQPSTMNSIKKQTSQNKLENKSNQSIQSCISSHSSESDSSSSSSSSSISEKRIQKQLKQNIGSRKSINENCSPAQKSRMSLSRINTRQEFQKKATLLSARTKKNWSSLEKSKSLNDVQLLVRPSLTSQINLNDPKLATQVKQNYKRLITIGQMQHVLELMQMQNAQKVAKQMIENNEDITTETVRTFKIYMPHNNIGNIIKEYQKLKLKQKLKRKIIKTVDIDNSLNLNNK